MADTKISALPASTTPLAGTEVLPIVQSSATKQVSVANLTAGRAISVTQLTLTTGNVIVASGQGIDFSATSSGSGTMTSELLADYEEGTWTPEFAPSGGSFAAITQDSYIGTYTKIGRVVYITGACRTDNLDVTGATGYITITGLPFTVGGYGAASIIRAELFATEPYSMTIPTSGTILELYKRATSNGDTAISAIADLTTGASSNRNDVLFTGFYLV